MGHAALINKFKKYKNRLCKCDEDTEMDLKEIDLHMS